MCNNIMSKCVKITHYNLSDGYLFVTININSFVIVKGKKQQQIATKDQLLTSIWRSCTCKCL